MLETEELMFLISQEQKEEYNQEHNKGNDDTDTNLEPDGGTKYDLLDYF